MSTDMAWDASWDVSLSRTSKTAGSINLAIPAAIGKALQEKGMWRARITVTEDGILIRPYVAERHSGHLKVDLPDWGTP